MSFTLLIPSIKEISTLLAISHASNNKTVLIERNGKVWANLSAKSTINQWNTRHKIIQKSFLDIVGQGDGGKLGCFIATSILLSLAKIDFQERRKNIEEIKSELPNILAQIKEMSQPSTDKEMLHLCEDIDFGKELVQAVSIAGLDSHISLEKYDGTHCEVVQTESFHERIPTPYIEDQVTLKGCMLALFSERIYTFSQVKECLELMGSFPNRPLLIVAPIIQGQALATIKRNREEGSVISYAVETPHVTWGRGWLDDIASFTGAEVYQRNLYSEFETRFYGSAKEICLKPREIIIEPYDDHAEVTAKRIDFLLKEAENSPHPHTKDLWKKRASKLAGSLVRIKVGGTTEAEAIMRRNLAEKKLISLSEMLKGGYILGSIPTLSYIKVKNDLLKRSLSAPLRVVSKNQNINISKDALKIKEMYDPFPAERLCSLIEKAISVAITIGSVGYILNKEK